MRFLSITSLIFCFVAAFHIHAQNPNNSSQHLRDLLQPIKSFSAHFKQRITDSEGFELQLSQGLFEVAQPYKIRWVVEQPMPQEIISDGITLWVFDPDLEQVTIQSFNPDIAATPAILFSGDLDQLDSAYLVHEVTEGHFTLTPAKAGSLFNSIDISFADNKPVSIALTDNLEQITTISFSNLQINPALNADRFNFDIPAGVDVINNLQSSIQSNLESNLQSHLQSKP